MRKFFLLIKSAFTPDPFAGFDEYEKEILKNGGFVFKNGVMHYSEIPNKA